MKNLTTIFLLTIFLNVFSGYCLADGTSDVTQFIENNIEQTFKVITDNTSSIDEKNKKLVAIFESIADVEWMARFAIGIQWKSLDPTQQEKYIKAYKEYLLKIYLPKFEKNHSQDYKILTIEEASPNQYIVHLLITQSPNDPKVKLDYRVKCAASKCYIRDLIVEGVSLVASQRSDFSSLLNEKGFDGLMENLEKKGAA